MPLLYSLLLAVERLLTFVLCSAELLVRRTLPPSAEVSFFNLVLTHLLSKGTLERTPGQRWHQPFSPPPAQPKVFSTRIPQPISPGFTTCEIGFYFSVGDLVVSLG